MGLVEVLVVGGVLVLVVAIVVAVIYANKKRREDLGAIAQQLKLTFSPGGNPSLTPLLANLEFFSHGRTRQVKNLMMGPISHQGRSLTLAIFDYYYTVGTHSDLETFGQTVLLFYDETLHLPDFSLRPEHLFDKLSNLVGFTDINFPDFPKFSKRYRLLGSQEGAVRSLFQPNVLPFFENHPICTEARGSTVILYPAGDHNRRSTSIHISNGHTNPESRLIQPKEIQSFLETGLRLINLLHRNTH